MYKYTDSVCQLSSQKFILPGLRGKLRKFSGLNAHF
jgi:hypothetical protein